MTEVYYTDLSDFVIKDISYYESILSKQRIDSVLKQSIPKNKKQSLAAGLLLHEVMKRHKKSEKNEQYTVNPFGKRLYEGFDVNISHSNHMVVCAWSNFKVGIDIENVKKYDERVPTRFFTAQEQKWICESSNPSRAFFLLWTRKESIAKWRGTGIQEDFFKEILLPNDLKIQSTTIDNQEVFLHKIEIQDFLISVCSTEKEIVANPEQVFFHF